MEKINSSEEQELNDEQLSEESTNEVEESSEDTQEEDSSEEEKPQTFNVNGQEVTLEELQKGYMRQDDYTRKAQDIAEQRRLIERVQQPQTQDTAKPALTAEQQQAREVLKQMGVAFKDDVAPTQQELKTLQEKIEDQKVDTEMNDLKSKFELDSNQTREVLRFAADKGLPSLELAYKAMVYDQKIEEAKAEGQKETAKNLKKRKDSMIESGKATANNPKEEIDTSKMSWDDTLEKAKQMLGD